MDKAKLDELKARLTAVIDSYKQLNKELPAELKSAVNQVLGSDSSKPATPSTQATQTPKPTDKPAETAAPAPKTDSSQQADKPLVFQDMAVKINGAEFIPKLKQIATRLGMDPNFIMATMKVESGFRPDIQNKSTKATGLIQFMPDTARGLGTTIEALVKMKGVQQLDWVEKYYKSNGRLVKQIKEPAEAYLLVFYPYAIGKPDSYVLGSQVSPAMAAKIAKQNPLYDTNKDGQITKGEVLEYQRKNNYKEVYMNLKGTDKADPAENKDKPADKPAETAKTLSGSVGEKGANKPADVKLVKTLLNKFGAGLDANNEACGPKTIAAIKKFQSEKAGLSRPDGLISPNGQTWKALNGQTVAPNKDGQTPKPNNGNNTPAPKPDDNPQPPAQGSGNGAKPGWIGKAESQKGVREADAKQYETIHNYFKSTGLKFGDGGIVSPTKTAWCAAFVSWCLKNSGTAALTGYPGVRAKAYEGYGQPTKGNKPAYGCIGVIKNGKQYHVGFIVGRNGNNIAMLGGNQGNSVNVANFALSKFTAFRFPANYQAPDAAYNLNGAEAVEGGNTR